MSAATRAPLPSAGSLRVVFDVQRAAFLHNSYPSALERRKHLEDLLRALRDRKEKLARAIASDFSSRARQEVMFSEVFVSMSSLKHSLGHVKHWMRPRSVSVDLPLQPARAWITPQPLGVVGIIVPWNYPLFLSIGPLAGALAAGNRVMLKPSEYTPAFSQALTELIASVFPPDHVAIVSGDSSVGREFSSLPFDHLLFTGSTAVGREVMRAASENLTPVTLELGGKSPVLVAPDADIESVAADIVYGKLLNAGQTCIAPDYVLIPKEKLRAFANAAAVAIDRYFPNAPDNPDYTAIIHQRHVDRLLGYLHEALESGVEMVPSTARSAAGRKLPPVLLLDPPDHLRVMEEEIFGPILPLKPYDTLEGAIAYINARPRPLALYLFTKSKRTMDLVEKHTISGALSVNETLVHCATEGLPFGGVGQSGMGSYHGRAGFETFSMMKPVFYRPFAGFAPMLRPPYGKLHERALKFLIG